MSHNRLQADVSQRLLQQMDFIVEIDQLKTVLRQSRLTDQSRRENDAEHSWHLAIMAVLLQEHATDAKQLDLVRVLKMLLIHDIVEIDAGDTFAYDEVGLESKAEREEQAAQRIFALLPTDQEQEFHDLWQEFEARETAEARYAAALDRLQPMLLNYYSEGAAWKQHGIRKEQVIKRNEHIGAGAPPLWDYAAQLIDEASSKGYLK